MTKKYDIAVIGGGPGGYSAAIRVAQLGGKVILFEEEQLGGTCLNKGCVPTKVLLEKAHFLEDVRKYTLNGFIKESGLFSWKKAIEKKEAVTKQLNNGVAGILNSFGIIVIKEKAFLSEEKKIRTSSGDLYEVDKIILATGSKSSLPPIENLELSERIVDSSRALSLKKLPKHIIIIGGGVIGIEFSSIFKSFGCRVSIIEFLPDILYNEDREITGYLKKELSKKDIDFYTNSKVVKVKEEDKKVFVTYEKDDNTEELEGSHILIATGRKPNLNGINTESLDLKLSSNGYIEVNEFMETNIEGIYAIGDVNGQFQLAYTAYAQADVAAENCMNGKKKFELSYIPRCVFSLPQFASVGLTEEEIKKQNIEYSKGLFPYQGNGKALAMEEPFGYVKTLVEKETNKIIGCHIVGANATELIHTMMLAMKLEATVMDLEELAFSHPTLSEMLRESVLDTEKKAIHKLKSRQ